MSFNLGQFRRDEIPVSSYLSSINDYEMREKIINNTSSSYIRYVDQMIVLTGNTVLNSGKSYYLKVAIHRIPSYSQNIIISLQNSSIEGNVQTLDTIYIPSGSSASYNNATIELVISPNGNYNQIVFTLTRSTTDQNIQNEDGTYGRKTNIEVLELAEIYNILNAMNPKPEKLIKIGVQGRTGLLMSINGEGIRIGPSGIYQINNGYKVTSMGFILQDSSSSIDGKDYFILDYQY